jgi:hypothetical protein
MKNKYKIIIFFHNNNNDNTLKLKIYIVFNMDFFHTPKKKLETN